MFTTGASAIDEKEKPPPVPPGKSAPARIPRFALKKLSVLVTTPDPFVDVSVIVAVLAHAVRHDDERHVRERAAHALRVRHAHDGIRRHDPERLDRAALGGVEELDGLESGLRRHARSAPEPPHPLDVRRREVHVRRELIREPADLAPAHGIRLVRQRERPHAGLADAARREVHVDDRVDFVGAARRLVDALRERRDGPRRAGERSVELEHVVLGEPARRRDGGDRRRAVLRATQRGAEPLRVSVEKLEIEHIFLAKMVQ
jgi:hypothetical protein